MQITDRRAHLAATPRRCAFDLFVVDAYATARPAGTQLLILKTPDNERLMADLVRGAGGGRAGGALVSSSQARNLPGRPKTDKEDARWIARLTEMGMLRSSFVPPPQTWALRAWQFADSSHFIRSFRQRYHQTPTQYARGQQPS
jgi:hypothetical protein